MTAVAHTPTSSSSQQDLNDKLRRLINAAPVMLFMKGTADEPQCGECRSSSRAGVVLLCCRVFGIFSLPHFQVALRPPPAGFSRSIVALLKEQNAEFSTFNILADDQVRQGLKTFSNWPTFPQLYVGGELIGGLDIVKVGGVMDTNAAPPVWLLHSPHEHVRGVQEMAESGELKEVLPKPKTQDELNKK